MMDSPDSRSEAVYCWKCGKWWIPPKQPVSCAVNHQPGDCCHYGATEYVPSDKGVEERQPCPQCGTQIVWLTGPPVDWKAKLSECGEGCPNAEVCKTCPCSHEDDACFPGERLRAEREQAIAKLAECRKEVAMLHSIHYRTDGCCTAQAELEAAQDRCRELEVERDEARHQRAVRGSEVVAAKGETRRLRSRFESVAQALDAQAEIATVALLDRQPVPSLVARAYDDAARLIRQAGNEEDK